DRTGRFRCRPGTGNRQSSARRCNRRSRMVRFGARAAWGVGFGAALARFTNIANYQEPPCFGLKLLHRTGDKYLGNRTRAGLRTNKLEDLSMATQSIRLISWNVNGRVKCLSDQSGALALLNLDVVALQEVVPTC